MGKGGKKSVLKCAGIRFRDFKCKLTCKRVLPFRDEPEKLKHPPERYNYITQSEWDAFVAERLDDKWEKTHNVQSERRAQNEYNHRISRKGYVGLEQELVNILLFFHNHIPF